MRKIVVFLSDTHAGHRLGLMCPNLTLYEEGPHGELSPHTPSLTATQTFLWSCYQDDIQAVVALADGDPIIVFHNGDITHGLKYKEQLVSTRAADQLTIAYHNVTPWLTLPNVTTLRLVAGTGSHVLQEASTPIMMLQMLQPAFSSKDIAVVYHDRPVVDGAIFDVAHHGPSSGIREWTQGNQLRYYAKSVVMHDVHRGKHPPHLIVRGHFHRLHPEVVQVRLSRVLLAFLRWREQGGDQTFLTIDDAIDFYETDIVLLPSYCWMGEYGRQATGSSSTVSIGLVAAEVIDGRLIKPLHYFEREVDLRRDEQL